MPMVGSYNYTSECKRLANLGVFVLITYTLYVLASVSVKNEYDAIPQLHNA